MEQKTKNAPINCITSCSSLVKKVGCSATALKQELLSSQNQAHTKHTSCATLSESLISIMNRGGPNSERDEKTHVKLFLATPHYHRPCAGRMLPRAFRPCSLSLSLPRARLFFCTVNQYCATGSLMIWNFGAFCELMT